MARLTPAEQRDRRGWDYEIVRKLASPHLGSVRAFAGDSGQGTRREVTEAEGLAGRATQYVVEYHFETLAGPNDWLSRSVAQFDLEAGGSYPHTKPAVTFVSRPIPWCPHVKPVTGVVCLGEGWVQAQGQMLLAQLIVHVMRLLNYDEPSPKDGYNAPALVYFRDVLHGRPLHPELVYPRLPSELTHETEGDEEETDADDSACFRIARPADAQIFRPMRSSR